jgi:hypothetical protein
MRVRVFLTVGLLVTSQLLLLGGIVLARWVVECGGGACAGTVRAASLLSSPRDVILTALVVAAPYLLAALVAAVTWLVTDFRVSQPATAPVPVRPAQTFSSAPQPAGLAVAGDADLRPFYDHLVISQEAA